MLSVILTSKNDQMFNGIGIIPKKIKDADKRARREARDPK